MSFFSEIKDQLKKAYYYVTGGSTPETESSAETKTPKPTVKLVSEKAIQPNTDVFKHDDKVKPPVQPIAKKVYPSRGRAEVKRSFALTCQKKGIVDYAKFQDELAKSVGKKNFKSMTEEQKAELLESAEMALLQTTSVSKNANYSKVVVTKAKNVYKSVETDKTFESVSEADKYLKDKENKKLMKKFFDSLPEDAQKAIKEFDKSVQERIDAINNNSKLSEQEKQSQRIEITKKLKFLRQHIFDEVLGMDSEKAMEAMAILNSDDWGTGAQDLLSTRADDAERERVASEIHNFAHLDTMICTAQARGENINREALKEYNAAFMSWKNEEASYQYHNDYMKARAEGRYSDDIFESIAEGIGIGAANNNVMTTEQKANFIEQWSKDNKDILSEEFLSREDIRSAREQKERSEKPSLSNDKIALKNNEQSVSVQNRITNPIKSSKTEQNKTENESVKHNVYFASMSESEVLEYVKTNKNVSYNDLEKDLGKEKTFKLMVKDIVLRNTYYNEIKNFIVHATDAKILVASTTSTDILELIYHNVQSNKVKADYIEQVEKTAPSTMRKVIENIKEKREEQNVNN